MLITHKTDLLCFFTPGKDVSVMWVLKHWDFTGEKGNGRHMACWEHVAVLSLVVSVMG